MTLGDIDTNLRDEGIGGRKLRQSERCNRELTDGQEADAELSDAHHANCKLADRDNATRRNWSSVRTVLERDMNERQTRDRDLRFVLVAPPVPHISRRIRSAALRARECVLRDLVSAFATGLHSQPPFQKTDVLTVRLRCVWRMLSLCNRVSDGPLKEAGTR